MERVLGKWDVLEEEARSSAGREVEAEVASLQGSLDEHLGAFVEASREKAKALAKALADAAGAEYAAVVGPLKARLEAGAAASAARAQHLLGVKDHCAAVLGDCLAGRDSGEDVGGYVRSFPACDAGAADGGAQGGEEAEAERLQQAVLQDPLGCSEARDARDLGFSVEVARGEFSGLLDGVLSAWVSSGAVGEAEVFIKELLSVLAGGCEPGEAGTGSAGGSLADSGFGSTVGLDIVREVQAEAARVGQGL
jgi:hypothetical protein